MKRKLNFDILESLRGLAALYVCIGHSRANLWIGGEHYKLLHPRNTWGLSDYLVVGLNMLTRLSTEFVIIFFVLSGFSIAHSLRNNTQAIPFYKRRFIRLYPPYIAALFWAMFVLFILQTALPHFLDKTYQTPTFDRLANSRQLFSWNIFLKNLIYLPQLDGILRPFWSLTMEVIFYIMAPFLFRNKKWYYILSLSMFFLFILSVIFQWKINSIAQNYLFYSIFFAFGVALYDSYEEIIRKLKFIVRPMAVFVVIGIYFMMIGISLTMRNNYELITSFLAAIMSGILIFYLTAKNLQIKWLMGVGRFSYTLYITHFPSIFLYLALYYTVTKATAPYIYNPLAFIPGVFLCLAIAYLHYLLVEKKSRKILDKLRSKKPRKEFKAEMIAAN